MGVGGWGLGVCSLQFAFTQPPPAAVAVEQQATATAQRFGCRELDLGGGGRVWGGGVVGRGGVFAIGDAADCGEPALTFLARRQALHLAGQFLGKKAGYGRAGRVPMSVPLGPERGLTQLPRRGLPVAGAWVTARLKGRRLFVAENRERMGYSG